MTELQQLAGDRWPSESRPIAAWTAVAYSRIQDRWCAGISRAPVVLARPRTKKGSRNPTNPRRRRITRRYTPPGQQANRVGNQSPRAQSGLEIKALVSQRWPLTLGSLAEVAQI